MTKIISSFALLVGITLLLSCSKEEQAAGITYDAKAFFAFNHTDVWPHRYKIMLGAFGKDTLNPLVYSEITKPQENDSVAFSLARIPENGKTIRLYLANQSNQPVYTFLKYAVNSTSELIEIPTGQIELLTYNRIQGQVLGNCIACHGASSGLPAAGLNLMPGSSYSKLVNIVSKNSEKKLVDPGSLANSFLIDVLRKNQNVFTHSASNIIPEEDIKLIEIWIAAGATNN